MKFFYSRVSTADQNEARQIEQAKQGDYDKVYLDKASGANMERAELNIMLNQLREGDSVTVLSIDRLGRNTRDILTIVDKITEQKASLVCLSPHFTSADHYGEFFLSMLACFAQLERKQILERQMQGIQIAKQAGKYKGRKPKTIENFEAVYKQWCDDKITAEQAAKLLEISRSTFYRRVKAYEDSKTVDFGCEAANKN